MKTAGPSQIIVARKNKGLPLSPYSCDDSLTWNLKLVHGGILIVACGTKAVA